jgi:hypothetical protein
MKGPEVEANSKFEIRNSNFGIQVSDFGFRISNLP